ncbi:hypothetical protein D3C80_581650 [compost metagenome]
MAAPTEAPVAAPPTVPAVVPAAVSKTPPVVLSNLSWSRASTSVEPHLGHCRVFSIKFPVFHH